ncbi:MULTISPECIES: hypothetical protein [unclassified Bacillus (in: firmicutes)]|nr:MULTISPECIES: hypothetical protein [unclassified Bacillus (in: firmicutes)]QNH48724.1 hypothetical protein H7F25_04415 [Bacillus sp. PAMC28571]QNK43019.1 hypothetical protein H7F24_10980 [Bacillus sp. PAMC22265]
MKYFYATASILGFASWLGCFRPSVIEAALVAHTLIGGILSVGITKKEDA